MLHIFTIFIECQTEPGEILDQKGPQAMQFTSLRRQTFRGSPQPPQLNTVAAPFQILTESAFISPSHLTRHNTTLSNTKP